MSIEAIKAAAAGVRTAQAALQEAAKNGGQQAIFDLFQKILAKHPDVERVSWTQYAPHFNDGDACVFHVREFCVVPAGEPLGRRADWNFDAHDERVSAVAYEELNAAFDEVADESLLLAVFGDHQRIVITADGGKAYYYDHD